MYELKRAGFVFAFVLGMTSTGYAETVGLWLFDEGDNGTGVNIPDGAQLLDSSGNELHFTYTAETENSTSMLGAQYTSDVAGTISGSGRTALETGPFVRVIDSVASDRFSLAQTGELTIEFWHKSKETQFQNVLGTVNPWPGTGLDPNRIQISTGIDSLGVPAQFRPTYAYVGVWIDNAGAGGSTAGLEAGKQKTDKDYDAPSSGFGASETEDVWKHVAFTASTISGDTHIYVDGVEAAHWEGGLTDRDFELFVPKDEEVCQGTGKACLRLMGNAVTENFNGFAFIDELRISDVALLPGDGTGEGELAWNVSLSADAPTGLAGDANKDGQVTGADLIGVQQNFGSVGPTPLQGDANDDGQVTGADLISVQQNFGSVAVASPIPEPTTAMALALSTIALWIRGRRKGF